MGSIERENIIVYHMYACNDYERRFKETLNSIISSGLINIVSSIYVNVCNPSDIDIERSLLNHKKIKYKKSTNIKSEVDSINLIHSLSQSHTGNILYLHSKGVTRCESKAVEDWRLYMEYFLIHQYKECIRQLEVNDTVSVNFSESPRPHYSGNLWWARAEYLKNLSQLPDNCSRHSCEWWLMDTSYKGDHKNLNSSNINHYTTRYPPSKYEHIIYN